MRNLLVTLRFDGTNYHGFQVQKNALSVCEIFQNALEQVLLTRPDVKGCSRTDAGVHANKYCLSMRVENSIPCDKLILALNRFLPCDIAALSAREVPEAFHARYNSHGKRYVYRILNSRIKDPFSPNLSYRFGYTLDADMLNEQAQAFVGTHDFAAFQSAGSDIEDTVRTIRSFSVRRQGEYVLFSVSGDGFLYNMVRIMVGTLIHIAMGRIPQGGISAIMDSRQRVNAGKTMPACGLYLDDVFYDLE